MAQYRQIKKPKKLKIKGISAVEVILATMVIAIISVVASSVIIRSVNTNYVLENNRQAYKILTESFTALGL
mgnify:CR=1 FL=1